MSLRNRVDPLGALIATPARGTLMGNRGCLHDAHGTILRDHATRRWIACRLAFKDRHRAIMPPGRWTALFFLDEATALSAGHRPCAECRRADYRAFRAAIAVPSSAPVEAVDAVLDAARKPIGPSRPIWRARAASLPDGAMVMIDGAPHLIIGASSRRWTPSGYGAKLARPAGTIDVLTPPPIVAALAAGYRPAIHESAFSD